MRIKSVTKFLSVIALSVIGFSATADAASAPGAIVSPQPVANFHSITSGHFGYPSYPKLQVAGALVNGDGGDGIFTYSSTPCTPDNGGTCLHDVDGNSYTRDQITGDFRQFGVVSGSPYDCSTITGSGPGGCIPADSLMTSLLSAASSKHLSLIKTGGIISRLSSSLTLPANLSLDCGRTWFGNNNATGNMSNLPGSIYLDHNVSLINAAGSGYHRCAAVSTAYALVAPFTTIRGEIDFWGKGGTVQTNGDTAFVCSVTPCTNTDISANGFDTCFQNSNSGAALYDNPEGDCNVGLAAFENNGKRTYRNINIFPFTTRGLKGVVDGTGVSTWNDSNSEWWTITGISDDGTGQCAIQSTEHSLIDLHTGDIVDITTLPTRESCQGHWTITKSGSNIILNGSSYTGPTTTGSFQSGHNVITNIANDTNIYPGQTINGVSGITNGTQILHIDHISHFAAIDTPATGNGSGVSIFFANSTGSLHMTTCNPPNGGCIQLSAAQRQVAGSSLGGIKAGGLATGIMLGGPGDDDKDAGAIIDVAQVLGHQVQMHIQTALHPSIHQLSGDTDSNHVLDPTQIGVWIDGVNEGVDISGRAIGRAGIALLVTDAAATKSCTLYKDLGATAGSSDFQAIQVDDGCLDLSGSHATAGDVMIGHLAGPIFFEGGNSFPNATIFTENDAARSLIMGGANVFADGYAPVFNNNTDSAKAGTTGSITAGNYQITGATFDTIGLVVGMTIVPPNKADLHEKTEIEDLTASPCIPSCSVTMTSPAKLSDTGTFLFKGLLPPQAQIQGMQRRLVGHDSGNSFDEIDSYGGTPGNVGVRTDGTLGQPTAVQNNETLNHIAGRGYGSTGVSSVDRVSIDERAAENWTDAGQGTYFSFNCTVPGGLITAECARLTGNSFTLSGTTKLFFIPTGGNTQTSLNDFGSRILSVSDFGAVGDGSTDDSAAFAAAFTAAQVNKINTVYVTKDAQYYLATGTSIPTKITLQCLSTRTDQSQNSSGVANGDHKTIPYALIIPTSATITVSSGGPSGAMKGCNWIHQDTQNIANPTNLQSLYNISGSGTNAGTFAGIGVTVAGDGALIADGNGYGFATGYQSIGFDSVQVHNVYVDSTNCFDVRTSQFIVGDWTNFGCYSLLTSRLSYGLQHLPIDAIAASPSTPANYRAHLSSPCLDSSNNCPRDGNTVWVGLPTGGNRPVGVESFAGHCTYHRIDDSNFECTDSQTAASTSTCTTVINLTRLTGCTLNMPYVKFGQAVSGVGIPVGATLFYYDKLTGTAFLDASHPATASGSVTITFTDNPYSGADLYNLRPFANWRNGVGINVNGVQGFSFSHCEVYTHATMYKLTNTADNTFTGCGAEDETADLDSNAICVDAEGSAKGTVWNGGEMHCGRNFGTVLLNNQNISSVLQWNYFHFTDMTGDLSTVILNNQSGNLFLESSPGASGGDHTGIFFIADASNFVDISNVFAPGAVMHTQSATAGTKVFGTNDTFATGTVTQHFTVANNLTAHAGGGQANATQLSTDLALVSNVATIGDSVALKPGATGTCETVANMSTRAMQIFGYAQTGDTINGIATGTGVSLPAKSVARFCMTVSTNWTAFIPSAVAVTGNVADLTGGLGVVYNVSGTAQTGYHTVIGTYTLSGGTVTITFSGAAIFGGTTNYQCFANDNGAAVVPASTQNQSASSFKVFGTGTDTGTYFCTGN